MTRLREMTTGFRRRPEGPVSGGDTDGGQSTPVRPFKRKTKLAGMIQKWIESFKMKSSGRN